MKNKPISVSVRRVSTESVLIAIAIACGFALVSEARAEVTNPTHERSAAEKPDLKTLTNPRHFPPDLAQMNKGRFVQHTLPPIPGDATRLEHPAEVYGVDYTKHPPQPLRIGNQGNDVKVGKPVISDTTRTLHIVDAHGKLNAAYYSYLKNFHEKPFSEIKGVDQILRFVLIESGHKPILISVNFKSMNNGTATITSKELGKDNRLDKNETTELTKEQADSLLDKVNYPELWKEVPYSKNSSEYAYWILENWDGRRTYQSATQYLPTDGLIKELGDELLSLTNLRPATSTTPAKPVTP